MIKQKTTALKEKNSILSVINKEQSIITNKRNNNPQFIIGYFKNVNKTIKRRDFYDKIFSIK